MCMTMSELEGEARSAEFERIHRSAIVNIDHVKEMRCERDDYIVVVQDHTSIRIGRTYRRRLLQ